MSSPGRGAPQILVGGKPQLRDMEMHLAGERDLPVIGITSSQEYCEPVLSLEEIRTVVGPDARVYFLPSEYLIKGLRDTLGVRLALSEASVRIWWPGLSRHSDPEDHPLVVALDGLPSQDTLIEFERAYELSRPVLRREIRLGEDLRAHLEHQLTVARARVSDAEQRLRDTQIARHAAVIRAESAEARRKAGSQEAADDGA